MRDYSHLDVVRGNDALYSYAVWRSPLLGAEIVFNDLQGKESARIATVYSQTAFNQDHLLNSKRAPSWEGLRGHHEIVGTMRAAKGKVSMAALTDGMDLFAHKQLRVASESADVQVAAKSKITLNSGWASLVIEDGNMTFYCPGSFTIKAGSFSFQGPDNAPTLLPSLPKSSLKISDQYSSSH